MTSTELNDTRIQLTNTQSQLNDTQLQLRDTKLQLSNTQREFKETKAKLEEKVSALESPSLIQLSGVHTWKICGFKEKMKQAKTGKKPLINSPPFYDHGYKFGLTLEPNDTILSTKFVSVNFFLMKGEYDAVLSWPFPNKKVTITLIDQQEDPRQRVNRVKSFTSHDLLFDNCFRRVGNKGVQISVCRTLISHDDLNERRYVVDDTIFIQIQIDPA